MKWKTFILRRRSPILYIDTGSTLLNLALTDTIHGGWATCRMHNLVGESSSGKTFLALTAQACCHYDPTFEGYNLPYDDAESADSFNKEVLFGASAAKAIRLPMTAKGGLRKSRLFQDFQGNLYSEMNRGSCLYILDSFDAIDDAAQRKKLDEALKAYEAGNTTAGSYSMTKQKSASEFFSGACDKMSETGSCVIIISQTRGNINSAFGGSTRSGGKALKFYSATEVWMRETGSITKVVNGKEAAVGIKTNIQVKKNKITGKRRTISIDIYYDYGLDDIGSCIDYLISMGTWSKSGQSSILVPVWKFKGTRAKLIRTIDDNPKRYEKMRDIVQSTWTDYENKIKTNRKPRFQ